ncbi:aldose 1-epimerase family protein [Microbacterium sp.]|uniref:aldose 1-epimerase family protein n=1 Tax=Microbacterium sp. TaxID=51671 RepID=UPI001AD1F946|nr:aldose 1-epimerase family protein [Microbacterium sp.]MBN9194356.1 aldose 1-epimerase family protein [Microbacterium sp.]
MARTPLSGIQHALRAGDYEAVVSSVGASLRSLTYGGRDLVLSYGADEVRPQYRGATLVPWPNRVVDGRYAFGGVEHRLALTEPERGHALHGLGVWLDFQAIDKSPSHVTLEAAVEAQAGYPWRMLVRTTFSLNSEGLTQSVTATNEGLSPAPWGTSAHPYLVAGSGRVDDWTLELPADSVVHATPDRLIPAGLTPVDAAQPERYDFRVARPIGAAQIDNAFTGIARDEAGLATLRLTDGAGAGVAMVWDQSCPWVQLFTSDQPGGADDPAHRAAVAVEPMTCAPDAFNAAAYAYDAGLIVVEPGASTTAQWRIEAIG